MEIDKVEYPNSKKRSSPSNVSTDDVSVISNKKLKISTSSSNGRITIDLTGDSDCEDESGHVDDTGSTISRNSSYILGKRLNTAQSQSQSQSIINLDLEIHEL